MKKCYSDFYSRIFLYMKMLIYGDKNKRVRAFGSLNVCSPEVSKRDGFKGILRGIIFVRA